MVGRAAHRELAREREPDQPRRRERRLLDRRRRQAPRARPPRSRRRRRHDARRHPLDRHPRQGGEHDPLPPRRRRRRRRRLRLPSVNRPRARTKSSIYTTAETILAAYQDPIVLESPDSSQITPERFLDGGSHTLYLAAPAHEQQRLQPLFATLIQELVAAAYERATRTGRPLDPPLLLVLDECANIAPIRDLATLASTGAGQGIQLVTVFQDLAQVETTYDRNTAATIVSNHRAKLILSGIADPTTLDYASRLLGDAERDQQSATRGYLGDTSTTESTTYRPLAANHELRQMPAGSGVLIYGRLPPARIRLRPWFEDRRQRRRVATPRS